MSATRVTFFRRLLSTTWLWLGIGISMVVGQDWLFFAMIFFVAMVALREYFALAKHQGAPVFTLTGMLCAAAYLLGSFFVLREDRGTGPTGMELGVLVAFLFVVFIRQMWREAAEREPLQAIAYTVFGLLYIPWLFNFLTKILFLAPRSEDGGTTGQYYLIFLLVVTKFSDMGAYVFGSLFGRHLFAPHISPNKTWEGIAGAVVLSLLGGYWVYAMVPGQLGALRFGDVTVLGVVLGLAAVVGDLAESIIKRSAVAKDSSRVLPGIGGTLDLIDSLLFTAPILYFYLWAVAGPTPS
ncbi:MAG: phosphatidate cytidylyltransferase [Terrimicrobiaceae bacterium]